MNNNVSPTRHTATVSIWSARTAPTHGWQVSIQPLRAPVIARWVNVSF